MAADQGLATLATPGCHGAPVVDLGGALDHVSVRRDARSVREDREALPETGWQMVERQERGGPRLGL